MPVLINMPRPTGCGECRFEDGLYCMAAMRETDYTNVRADWCPLVEVRKPRRKPDDRMLEESGFEL